MTDCDNITITASEYLTNANTIVDIDGTCAKTNSDAVDGVVVYGSALEILSNCSGEVVSNNIILTFRFYLNGSVQIQESANEFLIQCEVSTQTLLNSTWDYQLEPFARTSGHSSGKINFIKYKILKMYQKGCRHSHLILFILVLVMKVILFNFIHIKNNSNTQKVYKFSGKLASSKCLYSAKI